MTHFSKTLAVVATAAFIAAATPSLALPNNGAFNRSAEGFKLTFQDLCGDIANEADDIEDVESPIAPDKISSAQKKRSAEQLRDKARAAGCKI